METNLSILDTIIRIFIGMVIGAVFGSMGWIIGVIAVYPIVTGLGGYDPIYHYLGYSTRTEHPDVSDKIDYSKSALADSPESVSEYRQSA